MALPARSLQAVHPRDVTLADNARINAGDAIPAHVRRFILLSVTSVPHLEALLLLRENPAQRWNARQVARRLYMKEDTVADLLDALRVKGLIVMDATQVDEAGSGEAPCYIFRPATPALQQMLCDLAHCYSKNLLLVTHLIHSRQGNQAQQFADAFRIGKES